MQMDPGFISLLLSLCFLIFLVWFAVYTSFLIYSSFKGSPYLPTSKAAIQELLKAASLRRGQRMIELGCGDGRVLVEAVKTYGVVGRGIDINPFFIAKARRRARGIPPARIAFETADLRDISVSSYDVVYLFLLPNFINTFVPRWEQEARKGTLFISHAFVIERWKKYLVKKVTGTPYDTYFYRLS